MSRIPYSLFLIHSNQVKGKRFTGKGRREKSKSEEGQTGTSQDQPDRFIVELDFIFIKFVEYGAVYEYRSVYYQKGYVSFFFVFKYLSSNRILKIKIKLNNECRKIIN